MRKTVFLSMVCLLAGSYCFAQKNLRLKNDIDSVSYLIGVMTGTQFTEGIKQAPMKEFNFKANVAGYSAALLGEKTLLSIEEAQAYLQEYFTRISNQESDSNKQIGEKFLAENSQQPDVMQTASGLQYKVITQGNGARPLATDEVTVHYKGTTLDGKVFDSSYERGTPATFPLNQVIAGWTEGVQLMPVGSKYTFWIPSALAYGDRGAGNDIKPGSTLVFEVELLDIKAKEEPVVEEVIDTTFRVVGDYERIKPESTQTEQENAQEAYSFKEYTIVLLPNELKIVDKNKQELYTVSDTVYPIDAIALYAPLKENTPLIVVATRINDNGEKNIHDIFLIDSKKNTCTRSGRMNISSVADVISGEGEEILAHMNIGVQKSEIIFSFNVPYLTYYADEERSIQVPASDFYFLHHKKQGLQAKGAATNLSFFKKGK